MIKHIQKDTYDAVESIKSGIVEVEKGKELADKAGQSLQKIIVGSEEVVGIVTQAVAASAEKSTAAEEISKNIDGISNVTQETAHGIQQIAHASEDLSNLTVELQDLISRFKIDLSFSAELVTTHNKFSITSKVLVLLQGLPIIKKPLVFLI
jgi:methyl-accepting chemotaxis protein